MDKQQKVYVGIDPGVTGAISIIYPPGKLEVFKMPPTAEGLHEIFKGVKTPSNKVFTTVEKVHSSPQQGVSGAFTFGKSFGWCELAAEIFSDEVCFITPVKWQTALNCLTKGDKSITHEKAQKLFPTDHITKQCADSVLLAMYSYIKYKNEK